MLMELNGFTLKVILDTYLLETKTVYGVSKLMEELSKELV
jgi:hypothetical protein